jgi:DNA-binding transcriptional regulator/RsmH inhibitor MraZ
LIGQRHRFEIWSEGNWNQGRENWLADTSGDLDVPEEMQSISL